MSPGSMRSRGALAGPTPLDKMHRPSGACGRRSLQPLVKLADCSMVSAAAHFHPEIVQMPPSSLLSSPLVSIHVQLRCEPCERCDNGLRTASQTVTVTVGRALTLAPEWLARIGQSSMRAEAFRATPALVGSTMPIRSAGPARPRLGGLWPTLGAPDRTGPYETALAWSAESASRRAAVMRRTGTWECGSCGDKRVMCG